MTKILGHRGFAGIYPENTMLAFRKAYESGCDGIELDVQTTKDYEVVIIHDEDIQRTTDGIGMIKDYTLKELRQFNAGVHYQEGNEFHPIPTLKEYMEWACHKDILTNIELKNSVYYYNNLENDVLNLIREFQLEGKILLSSFNHASILKCKQLNSKIPVGFLIDGCIGNAGVYARKMGVECMHPYFAALTGEEIQICKEQKIRINTWTVNEEEDMKRLVSAGVDMIITDFPDRGKKVVSEFS